MYNMNNVAVSPAAESPIAIHARGPHTAMAAHVADHGRPEAQKLYDLARTFDRVYFDGKLGAMFVEIASPASPRALATHQPRTPEGVAMVIRIAPHVVEAGDALAADALLHEMIHAYQTITDQREPGYAGHGPAFAAKCNEIGQLMGLPAVGVKGRGRDADGRALPDCAQWPLNVRPEGYYGDVAAAPKSVVRVVTGKAAPRAPRAPKAAPRAVDPGAVALAALLACSPEQRATVLLAVGLVACPA